MKRVSQQCISKPAPWVVAKRIKKRMMGYREVAVLRFIKDHMGEHGRPPSYSEICEEFAIEKGNCHKVIVSLEKRGEVFRAGTGRQRRINIATI